MIAFIYQPRQGVVLMERKRIDHVLQRPLCRLRTQPDITN